MIHSDIEYDPTERNKLHPTVSLAPEELVAVRGLLLARTPKLSKHPTTTLGSIDAWLEDAGRNPQEGQKYEPKGEIARQIVMTVRQAANGELRQPDGSVTLPNADQRADALRLLESQPAMQVEERPVITDAGRVVEDELTRAHREEQDELRSRLLPGYEVSQAYSGKQVQHNADEPPITDDTIPDPPLYIVRHLRR